MAKIIGLLGLVLAIGGGAFWFFFFQQANIPFLEKQSQKEPCTLTPKPKEFNAEPYYSGPLIDAHVHMPVSSKIISTFAKQAGFEDMPALGDNGLTANYIVCLFESEGIKQAFGFHTTPNLSSGQTVNTVKKLAESYPGKIVPFLMPPPISALSPNPSSIKQIVNKNKELFKGFGELAFYMESFGDVSPDDPQFLEMYQIAQNHHLIVMIHPGRDHKEATEKVLRDFPQVSFLIHGGDNEDWIMDLMKKYHNFYYSLDANLTSLFGFERRHEFKKPTREEWLEFIKNNFDNRLSRALNEWKDKIEAHPDRFIWGTDRWYVWSFEEEVGAILVEFGRAFIARLDESVQENFAYKNAEKLLQER